MAAVTKLRAGTRVRLKAEYHTQLGNVVPKGTEGRVAALAPLRTTNDETLVFVSVEARGLRGWWLPARYLVRLK